MPAPFWKKVERVGVQDFPYWLDENDVCYYARDYISEGGYQASEANSLITNFKKSPDKRGRPEWRYKEEAIRRFAEDIAGIRNIDQFLVTCIPCSTMRNDPQYDSRLEDTLTRLKEIRPSVTVEFPLSFRANMMAAHLGGTRRIDDIHANLVWAGVVSPLSNIILVDDVLTTGAHFKACQQIITENVVNANVVGLFWAKTVWPNGQ